MITYKCDLNVIAMITLHHAASTLTLNIALNKDLAKYK